MLRRFFHLPCPLPCLSSLLCALGQLVCGASECSCRSTECGIDRGIGCKLARSVELVVCPLAKEACDGLFSVVELALGHRFELVTVAHGLGRVG